MNSTGLFSELDTGQSFLQANVANSFSLTLICFCEEEKYVRMFANCATTTQRLTVGNITATNWLTGGDYQLLCLCLTVCRMRRWDGLFICNTTHNSYFLPFYRVGWQCSWLLMTKHGIVISSLCLVTSISRPQETSFCYTAILPTKVVQTHIAPWNRAVTVLSR